MVIDIDLCCPVVSGSRKKLRWRALFVFRNFFCHGHLLQNRLRPLEDFTGVVDAFVNGR
jgi:hypothetical protein